MISSIIHLYREIQLTDILKAIDQIDHRKLKIGPKNLKKKSKFVSIICDI